MAQYPKFEESIRERIVDPSIQKSNFPSIAMVLEYHSQHNSVDIQTARPGTYQPGEIYKNIPCPQSGGVQAVAPSPGTMCRVSFPDGSSINPVITSFFNPFYAENDYQKQYSAQNDTPRFLMEI